MPTFLEAIIEAKRARVEVAKAVTDADELKEHAFSTVSDRRGFRNAIADRSRINVIAEFKRASPSKGVINNSLAPADVATDYQNGGAAAISVLTEEDFFKGSLDDLREIRAVVDLPVLRKDFIVDEFQILESGVARADAILLIVAALSTDELRQFQSLANELGLDVLVEIHDHREMEVAAEIGARLIGVNNRNLKTFEVSLDVSRELIAFAPDDAIVVSESGIDSRQDIEELSKLGYSGFLIGESLMRSGNSTETLEAWL